MAKQVAKQVSKPAPKSAPQKEETMAKTTELVKNGNGNGTAVANIDDDDEEAFLNEMKSDPGGGLSKAPEDNLVPLIYLLQPLSPQVMKGNPSYVKGAEAGDIFLRNAENPVIKGDREHGGMLFQPCHHWRDVVEWVPNRGGFAGRHDISCIPDRDTGKGWTGTLSDVQEIVNDDDPNGYPKLIRKSNGNEVVETRYFAGYVYFEDGRPPMPYIIPLSSTGHAFGKGWMTLQNGQTFKDGTPSDKSWIMIYRLTTRMKSNIKGSWFIYEVETERRVTREEYRRGRSLYLSMVGNKKKIDDEMMDAARSGNFASGQLNNNEEM